jgi:AraC family transcriptional regulator
MKLKRWVTGFGETLAFRDQAEFEAASGADAIVALAEARPALAWNCWVPASLWTVARGSARVQGRNVRGVLGPDDVFVAEHGSRITIQSASADTSMLGLLLPRTCLERVARTLNADAEAHTLVLPDLRRGDGELAVALMRLAHGALRGADDGAGERIEALLQDVLARQRPLDALLPRCPGRSYRYRRQVLLRLLRVRRHIEHAAAGNLNLAQLAEVATMSPTHFLRLYRDVFGETPHRHVVRSRLAAARDMLLTSSLGIAEVCRTLGFENRCAFARMFKQHYGVSPSRMRELAGAPVRAARSTVANGPALSHPRAA